MRVLFVDDEPKVLEGIERALFGEDEWEVLTATGGKEALELLATEAVDIVVSDMRMPIMDGAEFLQRVFERHPQCVRLVLSGQADEAASLRVVNVAHQFLCKPCSTESLKLALGRALVIRSLIDNEALRTLVGRVDQLPVAPAAFQELSLLLERPDASAREVAKIVRRDPALSAKILQLVNSAFFARADAITDLLPAVTRLGLRIVRYVALQVGVFGQAAGKGLPVDVDALQEGSLRASEIARHLVSARADQDSAAAAALLADLGILVLATFRPDAWRGLAAAAAAAGDVTPSSEAERNVFGCTHAEISAYLLSLWGLPDNVVRAVLAHHQTLPAASQAIDLTTAVMLAHTLSAIGVLPADWMLVPAVASCVQELVARSSVVAAARSAAPSKPAAAAVCELSTPTMPPARARLSFAPLPSTRAPGRKSHLDE